MKICLKFKLLSFSLNCLSSSSSSSSSVRYFNYLGNGLHTAGGRSGNDNHYIEQHERGNKALGMFQKKVNFLSSCPELVGKC